MAHKSSELYNETWQEIRSGNQQALVVLYKDLYQYLLNTGSRLINDQQLLKDMIQELFLEIWVQRAKLPNVQHVKAYMAKALRNRLLNAIRKEARLSMIDEEDIDQNICELSYLDKLLDHQHDKDRRAKLAAALQQLTPRQLELLEMRFFVQMDYEEMEKVLGISRKTIYNIVFRAIEILREGMG